MVRKIQGYGWVPDLPDQRDLRYAAPRRVLAKLPARCDLRPHCPEVLDQGDRGDFTLPYAYLTSDGLAYDFWTLRLVEA